MGARPMSALSFVAWPVQALGTEPLGRVLAGAAAVCAEAGIAIAGGHSIVDEEPKFGLFVTGLVHPARVAANSGARAGDVLVLTKRLGTGVLTTAVKRGHLDAACGLFAGEEAEDGLACRFMAQRRERLERRDLHVVGHVLEHRHHCRRDAQNQQRVDDHGASGGQEVGMNQLGQVARVLVGGPTVAARMVGVKMPMP